MKVWATAGVMVLSCLSVPSYCQKADRVLALASEDAGVVKAVVREVRQGTFPEVELTLWSAEHGEWYAAPRYKGSGRKTASFFVNPTNARDFAAYYLLPGDTVSVKRLQPRRGKTHTVWEIQEIKRLPQGTSVGEAGAGSGLLGTLATDLGAYHLGKSVRLVFTVRNVSRETLTLTFSSGQLYDFVIYSNESPVWHWSNGRFFTQALQSKELGAGKEWVLSEDWDQTLDDRSQAQPGLYRVTAYLTTMEGQQAAASAIFEIKQLAR